ncbi:MAG: 4-hydroxythreonine-4-phosphate dehydrogenase PdxA [Pseudomonadota bacterium]
MTEPLPLVLTPGDPAGVGTEIALKAWLAREGLPSFFLMDDPVRVTALATDLGLDVPVYEIEYPEEAHRAYRDALPVLLHEFERRVVPGQPEPGNAGGVIRAIDRAVEWARTGEVGGVVTCPINKKVLYDGAGFAFPGHTEYLAHLGNVDRTVMMLAAPGLRVVPVTIHVPLSDVPDLLSSELIVETAQITDRAMRRDFGIEMPRLAIAGLNPHAGEGGAMGSEDIAVIAPAIETLRAEGIDAVGPLPADTRFHPEARARYDVALTMYHDQGLIPIKTLDFARGVNVTLGLPFVRTSPDHGTAYDIAGKGVADPRSLLEAIRVAGEMAEARLAVQNGSQTG